MTPNPNPNQFRIKMPFEDRVRDYIRDHPNGTLKECAEVLGISLAAVVIACVVIACENLIAKGAARWEPDEQREQTLFEEPPA